MQFDITKTITLESIHGIDPKDLTPEQHMHWLKRFNEVFEWFSNAVTRAMEASTHDEDKVIRCAEDAARCILQLALPESEAFPYIYIMKQHLNERINMAKEELKDWIDEQKASHKSKAKIKDSDDFTEQLDSIADSNCPIYTWEIDEIWFVNKTELVEAYENAGYGDNPLENNGMTAIYFYIRQMLNDYAYELLS
jgi:hypothetical protein